MHRGPFRVVQPWGRNVAEQSTILSEHPSVAEAFQEIDRLSERMVRTGARTDAIELVVVDAEGNVVSRPETH
jgi:hypothetical protein